VRRVPFAAALVLLLAAVQQAGSLRARETFPAIATFGRDIRPLLAERCTICHTAGGSAPLPLVTFEDARASAAAIREQILTRRMPKWHAARGYGAFVNDQSLTPHEQALFVSWLDNGMPEGTPRGSVARPAAGGLAIATADERHLQIVVPPRGDLGRVPGDRGTWITGWTFAPGDPLITAAVISVDGVPVATWVAGDRPTRLPPGMGFRSGARIRVDVRRRAPAAQERPFVARRSIVTLLATNSTSLRRAWTEQVACGAARSGPPADLLAVRPLLDRAEARLSVARPGAPAAIVGWFRDFDPLYPRTYWLLRPIEMGPDTRLVADGACRVELTLTSSSGRR
jgi:hypothetical protein